MTTKAINLTEEQRHALGSLIAHTVGFECLDSLYEQLHNEFRPTQAYKPLKPWLEIKVMRRDYSKDNTEIAVLGKIYRNAPGRDQPAHDYVLEG